MLYVTTREKYDAYTTARTLQSDAAIDGGLYFPYKMPQFSQEEMTSFRDKSFGQNVADVLNLFFGTRLSGWDVEFSVGRYPVKLYSLHQKILIAECWRNLEGSYKGMERQLAARVQGCFPSEVKLTSWLRIAIRIAVLAGVFSELQRQGMDSMVDISVEEGDFNQVMALWYARQMGMPVGNIVFGCADGSSCWELIHNGAVRVSGQTSLELERLIRGTLGVDEALRFADCCQRGESYAVPAPLALQLRNGMSAAVVSPSRARDVIPNVFNTAGYQMDETMAIAYSALLDFRAKTGGSRTALILGHKEPGRREN